MLWPSSCPTTVLSCAKFIAFATQELVPSEKLGHAALVYPAQNP